VGTDLGAGNSIALAMPKSNSGLSRSLLGSELRGSLRTGRKGKERKDKKGRNLIRILLLKIIDAEVMIGDEGFAQWGGAAPVKTQCFY